MSDLTKLTTNELMSYVQHQTGIVLELSEIRRRLELKQVELPGTFVRCMAGHYYACTRGDEGCPTCILKEQLETCESALRPFATARGKAIEEGVLSLSAIMEWLSMIDFDKARAALEGQ